jgi:hypothetical protein
MPFTTELMLPNNDCGLIFSVFVVFSKSCNMIEMAILSLNPAKL